MPRRPTAFFFLALVVLISMGGGLWVALPHIAERLIESRLREQGIAPVTVTVSRVDLSGAHLERLSVDGNALVVEGAEVFWRAAALVPEALVVDRLRVNGRWTAEEGLSLGPLDAFLAGDPPQAGEAKGLELPVPRVEVRDAQAKIALPDGFLTVTMKGTATRAAPGPALDLMADLEAPGLSGRLTFRGTAAGDGATPVAGKGRIALTATGFAAPGIAGGVSGALSAEMGIGAGTITLATARPVVLTLKDLSPPLAEVVGAWPRRRISPSA